MQSNKYIYLGLIKQADDRSSCWKFLEGAAGVLEGGGGKGKADGQCKPPKIYFLVKAAFSKSKWI